MSEKKLGYVNDFIEIETFVNNETFETSIYTGLEEFFSEHLIQSNIDQKMKLEGINVFKIQVGDKIIVSPSQWAIRFREKHDLSDDNSNYEIEYTVEDIKMEFFTINPNSDSDKPVLRIKIYLVK